jgi:hypothetical protein
VRRSEEDPLIAAEEVSAGRFATARGDATDVAAVDIHDVLLIAAAAAARRLEDQALSIMTEVCFGVLTAKAQLANVA